MSLQPLLLRHPGYRAPRGGRSMIKVEAPIIVYKEPGVYTDEIYDIYGY